VLDRLLQGRARVLELEVRLQGVGQGDLRGAGVGAQLDRAPRIGERVGPAVWTTWMIARWASASPAFGSSASARWIAAAASSTRPTFRSTPAR
jgi:hypothetical protein